jgi:hypothetical protein
VGGKFKIACANTLSELEQSNTATRPAARQNVVVISNLSNKIEASTQVACVEK